MQWEGSRNWSTYLSPLIIVIYLLRVYKSNNNSEQTVGQDSKATRAALITADKNYAYTIIEDECFSKLNSLLHGLILSPIYYARQTAYKL